MARLILNGIERPAGTTGKHWEDVLVEVEQTVAGVGEVLTVVRFDGVEEPAFREADVLGRDVAAVALIEVESASPAQLLDQTIADAVQAAGVLADAADRAGAGFRGFGIQEANRELGEMVKGLSTLFTLARVLSDATAIPLDRAGAPPNTGAQMTVELTRYAGSLIEASQGGDWITVADILEFDLAPHLRRWPDVFRSFSASPSSPTAH
jgi:hypothetical protein